MGLFSFLKNAGSKLLRSEAEKNEAAAVDAAEAKAKKEAVLLGIVNETGICCDNFSVELDGDKVVAYGQTESLEDKEKIILTLGNVDGIATVDDRISVVTPPQATFYEVKPGDSLSKIAKAHYGDAMRYNEIFEANKPMLKSVDLIYPGQMLRIPNA